MNNLPMLRNTGVQLHCIEDIEKMAKILVASGMFEDTKDVAKACVKIIAGQEFGFTPYVAMTGIHLIQGKPTISANLIAATIKRSGKYNYRVVQHDATACRINFLEDDEVVGEASFTMEEAKQAGLAGKDIWRKYPKALLFARTVSMGARTYCPDVFCGPVYAPEDFDAVTNEHGTIIEIEATGAPLKIEAAAKGKAPKQTASAAQSVKPPAVNPDTVTAATSENSSEPPSVETAVNSATETEQSAPVAQTVATDVSSDTPTKKSDSEPKVTKTEMAQLLQAGTANGWERKAISDYICKTYSLDYKTIANMTWEQWEETVRHISDPKNAVKELQTA